MAYYTSQQARAIYLLRANITTVINENLNKLTVPILQEVEDGLLNAINEIEAMLRRNNVRVRDHPRLGIPALSQNPQIRKMLKRLENTIHVLCLLTDIIAEGHDAAATQEETESVVAGEGVLDLLMNNLMTLFSPPSSGTETE